MNPSFTYAQLAAFMNGSLYDHALLDAIEAAINAEPALAERAEALATSVPVGPLVRDAFAPVLHAPVPERVTAALAPREAEVLDLAAARPGKTRVLLVPANDAGDGRWRWPQFGAMAASLALGVMIGGPLIGERDGWPANGAGSLVLASTEVATMLDAAPSGQAQDVGRLGEGEVVLTFRNAEGQLCRQFMIAGAGGTTSDALACAGGQGRGWQIEAYGRRAAPAGEMKLAGGDAAHAVVTAVDAMIDSDPLVGPEELAELVKQ